jgi:hypothetical protein
MKKSDIYLLLTDEICSSLNVDYLKRSEYFRYFSYWKWESYSRFLEYKQYILTEALSTSYVSSPFKIAEIFLTPEEKHAFYRRSFYFFINEKKSTKAIRVLEDIEKRLKLDPQECFRVRNEYIEQKYFFNADFSDYTHAVVSSLHMSFANDGKIDQKEYESCRLLLESYRSVCPNFLIKTFNILSKISFLEISAQQKFELKQILKSAAYADRNVNQEEKDIFKRIITECSYCENDNMDFDRMIPFMALKVLVADEKLTKSEKEWFSSRFYMDELINSHEEAFWFLDIVSNHVDVFSKNFNFFAQVWNPKNEMFAFTSILFSAWLRSYKKVDAEILVSFESLIRKDSSIYVKDQLRKLDRGVVIKEEVYLLLNVLVNSIDNYELLNKYLSKEYVSRIFHALNGNHSLLKYYALVQSLMVDQKIDHKEYQELWNSFEKVGLCHQTFDHVLYEYCLLHLTDYKYDDYYKYLIS